MSKRFVGVIQIAISGFSFGFLGVFGKLGFSEGLSVGELLTYRFACATLIMAAGLAILARRRLIIARRDLTVCAGLGIFGYAVFSSFYFAAVQGVSVAMAAMLLYAYPILVALGAHFAFKERLTRVQVIALPLAIAGLAILLYGDLSGHPLAIASGLMAALCYAGYILVSSRYQRDIDPLTSGFYVMLFATLGLAIFHHPTRLSFERDQLLTILGIAFVCTVTPLVLFLSGLQKLGNTEASLLSTIEPVTAAVVGSLVLRETLQTHEMAGGAVVMLALVITVLGGARTRKAQALE